MERFPRLGGVCRRLKLDEARANVGLTRLRDLELNHLEAKKRNKNPVIYICRKAHAMWHMGGGR